MNIYNSDTHRTFSFSHLLLALLTSLLFFTSSSASSNELDGDQKTAIEELMQQTLETTHFPSAVIQIDKGGKTIYEKALGIADLEHNIPATMNTAYGIGSITKSFTGLAAIQLAYAGKLDLDKPVSEYLPDYEGPGSITTIRQLLSHTSGIPNYTSPAEIPGIQEGLKRTAYSRQQMVDFFDSLPLNFEPGSKWNYTNSGYYLLGLVIEAVSGMDYYDYLQANIFDPLEMTRTYFGDDSQIIPGRARGYGLDSNGYVNAPTWSYLVPFSAGSLVSTADDLVKYRRGVFHSEHFPPALREMLLQTTTMTGGELNYYTNGLIISDFYGRKKISHAGSIWGYTSNHAYYPEEDITIIILVNRQAEAPALPSTEAKIARVIFGIPQPEIKDLVQSEDILQRYAGNYGLHPYILGQDTYGFIANEGKLFIRFGGTDAEGPMIPLLAQGDGLFRAIFDDEWTFQFNYKPGEDKADSLVSHFMDGTFPAQRKD